MTAAPKNQGILCQHNALTPGFMSSFTPKIKVSVVLDEKYLELAVRVLHRAFELDQPAQ